MLSGIRKQREMLLSLNDEIQNGISSLRNISQEMMESEKVQEECKVFMKSYSREMPRVERLQSNLHHTVLELEKNKVNSSKELVTMKDQVIEFERKLNESRPNLAR